MEACVGDGASVKRDKHPVAENHLPKEEGRKKKRTKKSHHAFTSTNEDYDYEHLRYAHKTRMLREGQRTFVDVGDDEDDQLW